MGCALAGCRGVVMTTGTGIRGVAVAKRQHELSPTGAGDMTSGTIVGG